MFLEQSVMPNIDDDSLGNAFCGSAVSQRPPVAEGNFHMALLLQSTRRSIWPRALTDFNPESHSSFGMIVLNILHRMAKILLLREERKIFRNSLTDIPGMKKG
jgi:hypothetical protein